MSGLTKIKDRILEEAGEEAREKLKEAEEEAGKIKSEAVREADARASEIKARAEQKKGAIRERADSSVDLIKRAKLLEAKQEIIADVIDEAKAKIAALEDKEYFALMLKLIEKNALDAEGEVIFGKRDLERIPDGFREEVASAAGEKGGKLKVSDETGDIDSGFILRYGGIEENCELTALFEERKDDFSDIVKTILFS